MSKKRRQYSAEFKLETVMEGIRGEKCGLVRPPSCGPALVAHSLMGISPGNPPRGARYTTHSITNYVPSLSSS
jgi:hypothetical protein